MLRSSGDVFMIEKAINRNGCSMSLGYCGNDIFWPKRSITTEKDFRIARLEGLLI